MFTKDFKKSLFAKIVVVIITASFVLTSGPVGYCSRAYGEDNLKPQAVRQRTNTDGGTALGALIRDFGFVKIFAENVIKGDEVKGSDVGRVISLALLKEAKLAGAILGHSANRKAYIREVSTQIYEALLNTGLGESVAKDSARQRAFERYDEILQHRILAMDKAGLNVVTLCVGSDRDNLPIGEEIDDVLAQLQVDLGVVTADMLKRKTYYVAWEPAGKIGTGTAQATEDIRQVHQAIYDWLETKYGATIAKEVWGKSFKLLYGASVDKNNVDGIMAVKSQRAGMEGVQLVHGVLFASAGKKVEGFLPVAEGVNRAAVRDNGVFVCMVNFKEFKEQEKTPINDYVAQIYQAIFKGRISPEKTILAIADQDIHLTEWQIALVKAEKDYVRKEAVLEFLSPAVVAQTEEMEAGYTKEILTGEFQPAVEIINGKLEKLFAEKTRAGDVYLLLKKGIRYFALAKENTKEQTLMAMPMTELTDSKTRDEYYATLLEYVSVLTTISGKGVELINSAGDELRAFLSTKTSAAKARTNSPNVVEESFALENLVGIKRWQGDGIFEEPFFQFEYNIASAKEGVRPTLLTFKRNDNPKTRGWSAIVQPKYTHLIFGFGTIGSQVAQNSRKLGFNVVAVNRSPNEKPALAQSLGMPVYLLNSEDKKAFDKAGIKTEGILEDLLKSGAVDLITDATDGETKDPETGKEITVAASNKKYIYSKYPNIKVMYEGAEDPIIADRFFDVGTLNLLGISFSEIMKNVKSLFFPSCNTTSYGFVLDRIAFNSKSLTVRGSAHRRANDPWQKGKLAPDSTIFETGYHHAEDYLVGRQGDEFARIWNAFEKSSSGQPKLTTDASIIHLTKFHVIEIWISGSDEEGNPLTAESVKRFLSDEPRLALVDFKKNKFDIAQIGDVLQNRIGIIHPYTPIIQVLDLPSGDVKIVMAVPQESIVLPNNMNGIHALTGLFEREASIKLVNDVMQLAKISSKIESTLPLKSARVKLPISKPETDGGTAVVEGEDEYEEGDGLLTDGGTLSRNAVASIRGLADLFGVIKLEHLTAGFDVVDWNDDREGDLLKSDKKTKGSFPTVVEAIEIEDVQEIFVLTHSGRADGSYSPDLTLRPMVERVKKFLDFAAEEKGFEYEKGKFIKLKIPRENVVVEFLTYDPEKDKNSDDYFNRVQQQIKQAREQHKGKKIIFVVDNIRFFAEEQSKDPAVRRPFEEKLISLTGKTVNELFYISDAFEKSHRGEQASMELVKLIPFEHRGASKALKENVAQMIEFEKRVTGVLSFIYGGKKFDKFKQMADSAVRVSREVAGRKGKIWIIGALANPALDAEGKEIGLSLLPKEAEKKDFEKGWSKIKPTGVWQLPVDFLAFKGEEQAVVEVENKGVDRPGMLRKDQSQYDTGPKTLEAVIKYIRSLVEGDGLGVNGGAGIFEETWGRKGTFDSIEEASKAAERNVIVIFAGSDMNKAVDLYEKETGKKISPKALRSRGGGVVLDALNKGVMNLSPIAALIDTGSAALAISSPATPVVTPAVAPVVTPSVAPLMMPQPREISMSDLEDTVYSATTFPVSFGNFAKSVKASRVLEKSGAVIVSANAILENAGALTSLAFFVNTGKLVIYAQNEAVFNLLKNMGGELIAKHVVNGQANGVSIKDLAIGYAKNGPTVLVTSPLDRKGIDLTDIQNLGVQLINLESPKAQEGKINSMPLVIARAITGILQNDEVVVKQFRELSQNYKESGQISEQDLAVVNDLTAVMSTVPLVKVSEEVVQAQITYEETVSKI